MPKPISTRLPNRLVVALAYDGLCTFEFGIVVEIFGLPRPELGNDWYRFAVAAIDKGPLRATGGVTVSADGGIELLRRAGTIVVPGWKGTDAPIPPTLKSALRAAHRRGARILSVCSGVFVLANAGLLDGRRATTHWRYADALSRKYPRIQVESNVLYTDEGNVLTSAGSAAGIDACLHLVRRDHGPDIANHVARRLVVAPHRDGGQAQYIERPVTTESENARLGNLFDWIRARLHKNLTIEHLARQAGMSSRTLVRRFTEATGSGPGEWLIVERLGRAKELLESTRLPVESVAEKSGFGSAASLRHHFRQRLGTTPSSYRTRFAR